MALLLTICFVACLERTTGPPTLHQGVTQDSTAPPAPQTRQGSATFSVSLASSATPTVSTVGGSETGEVLPAIFGAASYDASRSIVRLPIVLRNDGRLRLHAPAAIDARASDLRVDAGVAVRPLRFMNADMSHRADGFIPPHESSPMRWVEVSVPSGVSAFHVTLHAQATVLFTIGPRAASTTPDSIEKHMQVQIFTHNEMPGHVTRDLLWLTFKRNATVEDRQEALDAVNGTVVGGTKLGAPDNYLVRIPAPAASGAGPLLGAIKILHALPQVRAAYINSLDPLNGQYTKPKDGSGFTSWQ